MVAWSRPTDGNTRRNDKQRRHPLLLRPGLPVRMDDQQVGPTGTDPTGLPACSRLGRSRGSRSPSRRASPAGRLRVPAQPAGHTSFDGSIATTFKRTGVASVGGTRAEVTREGPSRLGGATVPSRRHGGRRRPRRKLQRARYRERRSLPFLRSGARRPNRSRARRRTLAPADTDGRSIFWPSEAVYQCREPWKLDGFRPNFSRCLRHDMFNLSSESIGSSGRTTPELCGLRFIVRLLILGSKRPLHPVW